jgi:NADPH:quinone reductase-like Zn-dependent oxidoreductase
MVQMLKGAMGWNIAPRELGDRINDEIVELVRKQAVRPVVGRTVAFDQLPAAVEALAARATTGRTVILM